MKETSFIRQNKEKWEQCEQLLKSDKKDPARLSNLFIQITDDLSYSRTFYKNRSIRVYLNHIAHTFFSSIYRGKKRKKGTFINFWKDELPQVVIYCKRELLLSFILFSVAMAIGIFSSMRDPDFARTILGDSYIRMTTENIKSGDPMAVYKSGHQVGSFLYIAENNIKVSFQTYLLGILLGIGSIASIMYNGVMVGVFQFFFIERGLFVQSASVIWLHGTLEISSIIIAGAAGITLGRGLVFPGTYSRLQSFQAAAIRSLKLLLGVVPIICFAAFIEGFITRYADMPMFIKLALIAVSFFFITGYFIWYPYIKSKKGFAHPLAMEKVMGGSGHNPRIDSLRNNAEIFKDAFHFYNLKSSTLIRLALVAAFGITCVHFMMYQEETGESTGSGFWLVQMIQNVVFYCFPSGENYTALAHGIASAALTWFIGTALRTKQLAGSFLYRAMFFIQILIPVVGFYLIQTLESFPNGFVLIFYLLFMLICLIAVVQQTNIIKAAYQGFKMLFAGFIQITGLSGIMFILSFIFLSLLTSPLMYLYIEMLSWTTHMQDKLMGDWLSYIRFFLSSFMFYMVMAYVLVSTLLLYYSMREVLEAPALLQRISEVRLPNTRKESE